MSKIPKKYAAIMCAAAMIPSLFLCACGKGGDENDLEGYGAGTELKQTTAADDVFTLNYNSGYTLNPLNATNTSNQLVCNLIYENMLEVDNSFELVPNVITSWSTEDGRLWTFTVADDRYFHDGKKLTAYDVVYSLTVAANSDRYRSRLYSFRGASANDDNSFCVNISRVNMQFPKLLTIPVIEDGTFEREVPPGSGPYSLARNHKKLSAYKKYYSYETLPLKTIYLAEYNDVDGIISAFEDSLIDVVMNDPTAPTNLGYGATNEIRGYNTTNLHYIGFNVVSRVFNNAYMRSAVSLAFDREAIVAEQLGGYGLATTQIISPASQYYSTAVDRQNKYSMEKLRRILDNAGFVDYDDDDYLEMKVGDDSYQEISINFVVCASSSGKINVARKFAEDMKSIGIEVKVSELDWGTYKEAIDKGNFDMYYGEVRMNSDFDPSRLVCVDGKLNYGNIADPKVEEFVAAYLAANDDERMAAAENMSAYIANQAYIVPLCYEKHQMITHRGLIEGIQICENNPLYNFQNWKISFAEIIEGKDGISKEQGELS